MRQLPLKPYAPPKVTFLGRIRDVTQAMTTSVVPMADGSLSNSGIPLFS